MRRILPLLLLSLVSLPVFGQAAKEPLTNADIVDMSRQGVPESTILLTIQNTPAKFDVSAQGLMLLYKAGVAYPVLNQMVRAATPQSVHGYGVMTGKFPVDDAAGKTVRVSVYIKTENVQNGYAGLWWRVDGPGEGKNRPTLAFDNSMYRTIAGMPDPHNGWIRGATGTTPWTRYDIELPVDATASHINFGVLFTGTGTAWVDAMSVELDGVPYSNPPFDFDFESPLTGVYLGCTGVNGGCTDYKVSLDDTVAYSGRQSLKMQSVEETAVAQK